LAVKFSFSNPSLGQFQIDNGVIETEPCLE